MPADAKSDSFQQDFDKWLAETVGISRAFQDSLDRDDDWTFVIKLHAMVELALTHLVLSRLPESAKLEKIISNLDLNDKRKGKIAFIRAFGLLPDNAILFVQKLCELRNIAVHGLKRFNLDLAIYFKGLENKERGNWRNAITTFSVSRLTRAQIDLALAHPRSTLHACCISIMIRSWYGRPGWASRMYQSLIRERSPRQD